MLMEEMLPHWRSKGRAEPRRDWASLETDVECREADLAWEGKQRTEGSDVELQSRKDREGRGQ